MKFEPFELTLQIPNKDFSLTSVLTSIKIIPELSEKTLSSSDYKMTFKINIPKHILKVLEQYEFKLDNLFVRHEKLEEAILAFQNIIQQAINFKSTENFEKMNKVLMVKFKQSKSPAYDNYNNTTAGMKQNCVFQWFNAYHIVGKGMFGQEHIYLDPNKKKHNSYGQFHYPRAGEAFAKEFKIIPWTQEREDFLKSIESGFDSLYAKLENYFGNLDEEKIKELMSKKSDIKLLNRWENL